MFSSLDIAINIDDELAALLADYASYVGDHSAPATPTTLADATVPVSPAVDITATDATASTTPTDPPATSDATAVVDPMASSDPVVFTGTTAPAPDVSASMMDPSTDPTIAGETPLADMAVDLSNLPALEGLVELSDGNFSFDLSILEVGRAFVGSGFIDLP